MKYQKYVCNTLDEVRQATRNLNTARILPLYIEDGPVMKNVDNFVGVYNDGTGKFCAAVVSHYNLVQHQEYFNSFATAIDNLGIKFTMKITEVGNRAFGDIMFKGRNIQFKNLDEEFATGIRLINSYNKTTGLHVLPRFTRLACDNGMILTRTDKSVSVKHHSKIAQEINSFVGRKLNAIITSQQELQDWVSESMQDSKEWRICCAIMEKLFDQLKHREEIMKNLGISIIITKDKVTKKKSIAYVWDDEAERKEKLNRWMLYNSITMYLTHSEQITPHLEDAFQKRAEKLLITPLEDMPMAEIRV